jgi:hypothetical protein
MNLFTHGDSNTYGSELVENKPWPVLLSNKLECDVENMAKPGYSNNRIIRETLEYVINNIDNYKEMIVILGFTEQSRTEFFSDELKSWVSIETGNIHKDGNIKYSSEYYKIFHSFVYDSIMFWQNVLMVQSFLENYNIKYLFFSCFRDSLMERFYLYNKTIPDHLKILDSDSEAAINKYNSYMEGLDDRIKYLNIKILNHINNSKFVGLDDAYTMYNYDLNKNCDKGQFGHLLGEGHENWSNHLYDKLITVYDK